MLVDSARDDPGDSLAHGFGGLPCSLRKLKTSWIYYVVPERIGELKVVLVQFDPSIESLSNEESHGYASNSLLM